MTSVGVLSRRLAAVALCVCGTGLLAGGAAGAAEPNSMSEAAAAGDPAASAPVVEPPAVFEYNGEQISEQTVGELELACLQTDDRFICKDSTSDFDGASASKAREGATASSSCGVVELWLYRHKQYGGTALGYYNYYTWANVIPEMNNATTSYRTGTAKAHLSDFANGGGYWYPGNTGYCAYHSNVSQPYPEWNDRVSSRYRY